MRIFFSVITVLGLVVSLGSVIVAQDTAADEEAIRQMDASWSEAWNSRDAEAIAAMHAEDADAIDAMGQTVNGRDGILAKMIGEFESMPEGVSAETEITHLRLIRTDLAVLDGAWAVSGLPEGMPAAGLYTIFLKKQDGEWRIVADRSRIPMVPPSAAE